MRTTLFMYLPLNARWYIEQGHTNCHKGFFYLESSKMYSKNHIG